MNIQEYLAKKKLIQNKILEFIDAKEKIEENFQNVVQMINDLKIRDDLHETKTILYLLSKIINNHYRVPDFFKKIEKILQSLRQDILKYFTNYEIFSIFKGNKRILLFLLREKIIRIDEFISNILTNIKYQKYRYPHYLYPEIKQYLSPILNFEISKLISEDFEEKRNLGENDNLLAQIIRKDSIDEFITYVNRSNYSLNSEIEISIFETNSFLLKNGSQTTLIEYAAFHGSVQIFKYLYLNEAKMAPKIWIYAIHGQNPELIHLIEENNIEPECLIIDHSKNEYDYLYEKKIKSFQDCLKESIKCHHNEIADYIRENYSNKDDDEFENTFDRNTFSNAFHFYNFVNFPQDFNHKFVFFYLCKFDYFTILNFLLKDERFDLNEKVISTSLPFIKFYFQKNSSSFNIKKFNKIFYSTSKNGVFFI